MKAETLARCIVTLVVPLLAITASLPVAIAADPPSGSLEIDVRILDTAGEAVDQSSSVTISEDES